MTAPDPRIDLLLRQLGKAFDVRSWHGTNLLGSLRGLTPEGAAWRPQPERHNIQEIVVHAAYWKYRVYRLLTEDPPRSFTLKGSDWFPRPIDGTAAELEGDVALLRDWHARLMRAVAGLDSARLHEPAGSGKNTHFDLIAGAAAHDLYHAGQIQLLKRLRRGSKQP